MIYIVLQLRLKNFLFFIIEIADKMLQSSLAEMIKQGNYTNSFNIFEPGNLLTSAFTLTDSSSIITSNNKEELFLLTPPSKLKIQPLNVSPEQSVKRNIYAKRKVSNIDLKKPSATSIEHIIIQNQCLVDQPSNKLTFVNNINDIFTHKPQSSSIQIKSSFFAEQQKNLQIKIPNNQEDKSFSDTFYKSNSPVSHQSSSQSLGFVNGSQRNKFTVQQSSNLDDLQAMVNAVKKNNIKLNNIYQYLLKKPFILGPYASNQFGANLEWCLLKTLIQKTKIKSLCR